MPRRRGAPPAAVGDAGCAATALWGWWWPAAGFTAWHLAPQAVLPSRRGRPAFLVARFWLGRST